MTRWGQRGGRFDQRHELDNIFEATEVDLQEWEGTTVKWFMFDSQSSVADELYDVGSVATGRVWVSGIELPVISVVRTEGSELANDQGFYVTDAIHISVSMRQAENAGLDDLVRNADKHLFDRLVWQGTVFNVVHIQARGLIRNRHVVVGIDAVQVNPEELVNDDIFADYVPEVYPDAAPPGDPEEWYAWRNGGGTTPPTDGDPIYGV